MPIEQKHYTLLLSVQRIYDYLLLRIIRVALCADKTEKVMVESFYLGT